MKQKYTDMTPLEIRIAILRAGTTHAAIARAIAEDGKSCSSVMIRRVIDGKVVSDRVRQGIASAIGRPKETIWRNYYINYTPGRRGRRVSGRTRHIVRTVAA